EDRLLLRLVSQDDEAAFTELYERFWKKLFVAAYNRFKEKQQAEDIVHEVFASLWANRKKIEIESVDNYSPYAKNMAKIALCCLRC
ncbi:MAG: RNA polymerase sigma factor, partial [Chitinophagaceae bacterium]